MDFRKWQQSNLDQGPKQQENYNTSVGAPQRFEVDNSLPGQQKKKDNWSL